jgi:tripeptidyl-peptidase-1
MRHHWLSAFLSFSLAPLDNPLQGTTIDLHIALKPERENALIDALYEVSDPKLPKHVPLPLLPSARAPVLTCTVFRYGAYLSKEQVAELVAPHPDTRGLVISWLERSGVSSPVSTTHGGGWLTVTGIPVSQADDLLGASYQVYRYAGTTKTILRTLSYSLPAALREHVRTVVPTTYFSPPRTS